ncbi:MAG: DNA primase, partial [Micavibrio aeruginosavorus]|nr:DNA primase [Micavibrio aeruginosavorus]
MPPLRRPSFAEDRVSVLILLACILNHPALFGWVEEDMGQVDIPEPRFAALRQAIIQFLGSQAAGVETGALHNHLIDQGFAPELSAILSENVYTHAGFARPQMALEFVRKGWQDTLSFMQKKTVLRELKAAGQALAADFSDENEQRVMALHRSNRTGEGQD